MFRTCVDLIALVVPACGIIDSPKLRERKFDIPNPLRIFTPQRGNVYYIGAANGCGLRKCREGFGNFLGSSTVLRVVRNQLLFEVRCPGALPLSTPSQGDKTRSRWFRPTEA